MLTVDELIVSLRDTSVPTILVEGVNDVWMFRELRSVLRLEKIDFLPCGGRANLLEIFNRRKELGSARVGYFADQDIWAYIGIPGEFSVISLTSGYSLENDLLSEYQYRVLIGRDNEAEYVKMLNIVVMWYAHEVRLALDNKESLLSESVFKVLMESGEPNESFLVGRKFEHIDDDLHSKITSNPDLMLRGKTLLQLICRVLGSRGRRGRYEKDTLLDLCIRHQTVSSTLGSRIYNLANAL